MRILRVTDTNLQLILSSLHLRSLRLWRWQIVDLHRKEGTAIWYTSCINYKLSRNRRLVWSILHACKHSSKPSCKTVQSFKGSSIGFTGQCISWTRICRISTVRSSDQVSSAQNSSVVHKHILTARIDFKSKPICGEFCWLFSNTG